MAVRGSWTRIYAAKNSYFVYGPRLGRVYLLGERDLEDSVLRWVIGLGSLCHEQHIADPAKRVLYDLTRFKDLPSPSVPVSRRIAYRILSWSRYLLPFRLVVSLLAKLARWRQPDTTISLADIARRIYCIEQTTGIADCYPRALVTAYLSLRSGRDCTLLIGAIVPTRHLHAWCSTEGLVPYEAMPEHYMYQPLIRWNLAP